MQILLNQCFIGRRHLFITGQRHGRQFRTAEPQAIGGRRKAHRTLHQPGPGLATSGWFTAQQFDFIKNAGTAGQLAGKGDDGGKKTVHGQRTDGDPGQWINHKTGTGGLMHHTDIHRIRHQRMVAPHFIDHLLHIAAAQHQQTQGTEMHGLYMSSHLQGKRRVSGFFFQLLPQAGHYLNGHPAVGLAFQFREIQSGRSEKPLRIETVFR